MVQTKCPSVHFCLKSRLFPTEKRNAFYHCLKKQREGEQKDVVQRGVGVVCRVVVVVVRSNDVLVLVLV